MGEEGAAGEADEDDGGPDEQEGAAEGFEQDLTVVGAATDLEDGAVGQRVGGDGEVAFGIARDADNFLTAFEGADAIGKWNLDGAEFDPFVGDAGEGDVVAGGDEADEEGGLFGGNGIAGDGDAETLETGVSVGGGVFPEFAVEEFLFALVDGGGEEPVEDAEEDGGGGEKDDGVPEAEMEREGAEPASWRCGIGWRDEGHGSGGAKDVTDAAEGMQAGSFGIDLGAEPVDEDIDHIGLGIEAVVPDMFKDHGLGDGAPGVAHEVFEQGKLAGLEFDGIGSATDLAGEEIEGEISDGEAGRFGGAGGTTDEGLDAGEEFGEGEGLGQIIVATSLESADPVIDGGLGTQEEDGDPIALGAEALDELEAVKTGQHDIDDGGVVGGGGGEIEGGTAVMADIDGEPALTESVGDERSDLGIVLDYEEAHVGDHAGGEGRERAGRRGK